MSRSKIEWTDETWNPVRGCSLKSDGCRNCYAMKFAHRFAGEGKPYDGLTELGPEGPRWTGEVRTVPEILGAPLGWKRRRRCFVCSMSDLFHESVPFGFIAAVFGVMGSAHRHSFQLLTKRPDRAALFFEWMRTQAERTRKPPEVLAAEYPATELGDLVDVAARWPLTNVELGVSVENQAALIARVWELIEIPAARHFLSIEPLLGPLDFEDGPMEPHESTGGPFSLLEFIDWVIVGGESGAGARPMHPDWVRSIRDECVELGVPFFFKQWGMWAPDGPKDVAKQIVCRRGWTGDPDFQGWLAHHREHHEEPVGSCFPEVMFCVGKRDAGRELDGRTWAQEPKRGIR